MGIACFVSNTEMSIILIDVLASEQSIDVPFVVAMPPTCTWHAKRVLCCPCIWNFGYVRGGILKTKHNAQCTMHNAQCTMQHAHCPMPKAIVLYMNIQTMLSPWGSDICCGLVGPCLVYVYLMCGMGNWGTGETNGGGA